MPSGSALSVSRAYRMKVGATSIARTVAPSRTSSRVFDPSPQPISSPQRAWIGGSMSRNAGVFSPSRYMSYPARACRVQVSAFASQYCATSARFMEADPPIGAHHERELVAERTAWRALHDRLIAVAMGDNGMTDEDEWCAIYLQNRLEGAGGCRGGSSPWLGAKSSAFMIPPVRTCTRRMPTSRSISIAAISR